MPLQQRTEPPPFIKCYRVINPDAADWGRVGMMVDVLDEEDVLWFWTALLSCLPRRWRCHWIVLDFGDGKEPEAFRRDELEEA